jgi:uncharacterized protein (TIGR02996 family)
MTTPPELLALLAAYKVNPDDAVRMLVLADWLEERGDPLLAARGEFVRLQSQTRRTAGNKEREQELQRLHGERWLGPLQAVAETYVWHHGLLHVGIAAAALAGPAAEWLTAEDFAWVEGVTVSGLSTTGAVYVASLPWLRALTTLELRGDVGDEGAAALAESPHVGNLRTLLLRHDGIGDRGAAALARSPALVSLSALSLAYNLFRDAGALALAASPHLARLRQLNLEGNRIGHHGLPALRAAAQAHPRLWINIGARAQL